MSEKKVEVAGFGVLQVIVPCPRTRPGIALSKVTPRVQHLVDDSSLGMDSRIDRISIFLTVNGELSLSLIDHGIRRIQTVGKCLNIAVISPPWCFSELSDSEFDEFVESALLRGVVLGAQRLSHSTTVFQQRLQSVLRTRRLIDMFSSELM